MIMRTMVCMLLILTSFVQNCRSEVFKNLNGQGRWNEYSGWFGMSAVFAGAAILSYSQANGFEKRSNQWHNDASVIAASPYPDPDVVRRWESEADRLHRKSTNYKRLCYALSLASISFAVGGMLTVRFNGDQVSITRSIRFG